jgi:hypothetical protein
MITNYLSIWESAPLKAATYTENNTKRINEIYIHALNGIRNHDPSARASGHCDRHGYKLYRSQNQTEAKN